MSLLDHGSTAEETKVNSEDTKDEAFVTHLLHDYVSSHNNLTNFFSIVLYVLKFDITGFIVLERLHDAHVVTHDNITTLSGVQFGTFGEWEGGPMWLRGVFDCRTVRLA